jgi:hypothetical protein
MSDDKASWDERLQRLERYWRERHPASGLPGRQHIDPLEMGSTLLPYLFLLDVEGPPLRFRYRLVGTHMVKGIGRDPTGQLMETAFPDFMFGSSYPDYVACVRNRAAIRRKGAPTSVQTRNYIVIDRLLLPLAGDGATVDRILGASIYWDSRGRRL